MDNSGCAEAIEDMKRRIRKLKQMEIRLRYDGSLRPGAPLVWDTFFDLRGGEMRGARYALNALAAMSREAYKGVVSEYFARVYYEYYRQNGLLYIVSYDPAALAQLGLPFDAGESEVKCRFRELAKLCHPDTGGDAERFIALMEVYKKLIGEV